MNIYALTDTFSGAVGDLHDFGSDTPPILNESKGVQWLPYTPPDPVLPTLDEIKAQKRAEINAERDQREVAGFVFNGKTFDSDQRSTDRIQVASIAAQSAIMAGQPFIIDWTAADNSVVTLDAAGMLGLVAAFATHGAGLHYTAKALKAHADAATTQAELDAITWPA